MERDERRKYIDVINRLFRMVCILTPQWHAQKSQLGILKHIFCSKIDFRHFRKSISDRVASYRKTAKKAVFSYLLQTLCIKCTRARFYGSAKSSGTLKEWSDLKQKQNFFEIEENFKISPPMKPPPYCRFWNLRNWSKNDRKKREKLTKKKGMGRL